MLHTMMKIRKLKTHLQYPTAIIVLFFPGLMLGLGTNWLAPDSQKGRVFLISEENDKAIGRHGIDTYLQNTREGASGPLPSEYHR